MKRICMFTLACVGILLLSTPYSDSMEFGPTGYRMRRQLEELTAQLRNYRQRHGRYPSNDEGLWAVVDEARAQGPLPTNTNVHGTRTDILSPWKVPYMYENRTNSTKEQFARSPMPSTAYSKSAVNVDDGVFVYSVDGMLLEEAVTHRRHSMYIRRAVGGILCLCVITISFWRVRVFLRFRDKRVNGVKAVLSSGVLDGVILGTIVGVLGGAGGTCYAMSSACPPRDPRATAKQNELIEQYHTNGVINAETYRRLKEATVRNDLNTRP